MPREPPPDSEPTGARMPMPTCRQPPSAQHAVKREDQANGHRCHQGNPESQRAQEPRNDRARCEQPKAPGPPRGRCHTGVVQVRVTKYGAVSPPSQTGVCGAKGDSQVQKSHRGQGAVCPRCLLSSDAQMLRCACRDRVGQCRTGTSRSGRQMVAGEQARGRLALRVSPLVCRLQNFLFSSKLNNS